MLDALAGLTQALTDLLSFACCQTEAPVYLQTYPQVVSLGGNEAARERALNSAIASERREGQTRAPG